MHTLKNIRPREKDKKSHSVLLQRTNEKDKELTKMFVFEYMRHYGSSADERKVAVSKQHPLQSSWKCVRREDVKSTIDAKKAAEIYFSGLLSFPGRRWLWSQIDYSFQMDISEKIDIGLWWLSQEGETWTHRKKIISWTGMRLSILQQHSWAAKASTCAGSSKVWVSDSSRRSLNFKRFTGIVWTPMGYRHPLLMLLLPLRQRLYWIRLFEKKLTEIRKRSVMGRYLKYVYRSSQNSLRSFKLVDKTSGSPVICNGWRFCNGIIAGVHESFLNINGLSNIIKAIKDCRMLHLGTPVLLPTGAKWDLVMIRSLPAVVIMELIPAEAARCGF